MVDALKVLGSTELFSRNLSHYLDAFFIRPKLFKATNSNWEYILRASNLFRQQRWGQAYNGA